MLVAVQVFATSFAPPGKNIGQRIMAANKDGKCVFLVAFNKNDANKDKAVSIARMASAKKRRAVEVIELNTSDKGNSELTLNYGLSEATLPLIIVLDNKGSAKSGFPLAAATPEDLLKSIPSPKFSAIVDAFNNQKSVFIVAYTSSMKNREAATQICKEAMKEMKDQAITVEVNTGDKEETTLLTNFNIDVSTAEPAIYAINKTGVVTGIFNVESTSAQLVMAASKTEAGTCGPGCTKPGSNCAPIKK